MSSLLKCITFCFLLWAISSCKSHPTVVQRGFYYWKNNRYLDYSDIGLMRKAAPEKLYIKFFEVEKDPTLRAIPVAKTEFDLFDEYYRSRVKYDSVLEKICNHIEVIPTVFIRNEVLANVSYWDLDVLADNIWYLINRYYKARFSNAPEAFNEIQIDCDWTISTRKNYFYLLQKIKSLSGKTISCTLRMYPFAYPDTMGVPPVDKATLMCYNLIGTFDERNRNSILDTKELEAYLKIAKVYPLHLDVALPVYAWSLVYQNNVFAGVINQPMMHGDVVYRQDTPLWYEVQSDTIINEFFLRPGDQIKYESVSDETIHEAIVLLNQYLNYDDTITVSLFHLDANMLNTYDSTSIDNFYSAFK